MHRWLRGLSIVVFQPCMSPISQTTQQCMISIVNMDCYKSPPVQTLALFAKLLTLASVLLVFEGCKRSAYDGNVYILWFMARQGCSKNSIMSLSMSKSERDIFSLFPTQSIEMKHVLQFLKSLSMHGGKRCLVIAVCISIILVHRFGEGSESSFGYS